MKNKLRSSEVTEGARMTGARSLWRANGMQNKHFGKPIIAIANSFTQFVPGHGHLHSIGQVVRNRIMEQGYFAAEFNTIAVDDGIAMGHSGMLYSLPSRDLIADSVEYMCNAHKVDALVCISNCDKITPGMLMAAMRLNIPTIFVSGGPMEAGVVQGKKYDLVDAMVLGATDGTDEKTLTDVEMGACPTCGSCSGMFTANSMNILTEAIGLGLPGNGTIVATHKNREKLFETAADTIIKIANDFYLNGNAEVLPRNIASRKSFLNAMALDIAMGGSTNTILHLLAIAKEAETEFSLADIDVLSRKVPCLCKVSPNSDYHIEDVNRAGGVFAILGELDKGNLIHNETIRIDGLKLHDAIAKYSITDGQISDEATEIYKSAPGRLGRNLIMGSQNKQYENFDSDRKHGCIRSIENAYFNDGGLAVLYGNIADKGCIVKTAGIDENLFVFEGPARIFESQEDACDAILNDEIIAGDVVVIRYEGPRGGPGMQEMLYPTSYLKAKGLGKKCALITDGRFSGGTSGLSIGHVSTEAASGGLIALLKDGDKIKIDIPQRTINVELSKEQIESRHEQEKKREKPYSPVSRKRKISKALQAYAHFASSADEGGIRKLD